jgi:hypothetical protein
LRNSKRPTVALSGRLHLRSEAEFTSALRADTPTYLPGAPRTAHPRQEFRTSGNPGSECRGRLRAAQRKRSREENRDARVRLSGPPPTARPRCTSDHHSPRPSCAHAPPPSSCCWPASPSWSNCSLTKSAASLEKGFPPGRTCWQHGRSALDFLSQLLRGPPAALALPP